MGVDLEAEFGGEVLDGAHSGGGLWEKSKRGGLMLVILCTWDGDFGSGIRAVRLRVICALQ